MAGTVDGVIELLCANGTRLFCKTNYIKPALLAFLLFDVCSNCEDKCTDLAREVCSAYNYTGKAMLFITVM